MKELDKCRYYYPGACAKQKKCIANAEMYGQMTDGQSWTNPQDPHVKGRIEAFRKQAANSNCQNITGNDKLVSDFNAGKIKP